MGHIFVKFKQLIYADLIEIDVADFRALCSTEAAETSLATMNSNPTKDPVVELDLTMLCYTAMWYQTLQRSPLLPLPSSFYSTRHRTRRLAQFCKIERSGLSPYEAATHLF